VAEPDPEPLSRPVWWLAARQRASELKVDEEGQRIVALLISHVETAWPWIEELEAFCHPHLPSYKIPRSMEIIEGELPKGGSGKILKKNLREKYWQGKARLIG
jgi:acyl-CoA synthetase (AMP-forming)/AMP-acid ligase II